MEVFSGKEETCPHTEGKGRNIHQSKQSCQKAETELTKKWWTWSLKYFGCKLRARQTLHLPVDKMKLDFAWGIKLFGSLRANALMWYLKDAPDLLRQCSSMLVSWKMLWSCLPAKGQRNPSLGHGQCCIPSSLLSHLPCQTSATVMGWPVPEQ